MDLHPETYVTPNLRLLRKLGEGGMGSVWLAHNLALSTQVVIKFMAPAFTKHAPSVARFAQEASLAAKVHHPHVVQVFDHGLTDTGVPFIVMELLEGRTLAEVFDIRPRLRPAEVSAIVAQTAKALQRVHDLGLVHRDIKPENLFLCALGTGEIFVKVLDFGIAKARNDSANNLTSTGVTMGTPFYMSPELIVSAKYVDGQADLWALAVVAFEALTGVRPFDGETVGAVTLELHAQRHRHVTDLVPDLPPELDAWFERAFARCPADRFPDARSMARALSAIVPPLRNSMPAQLPSPPPMSQPISTPPPISTTGVVRVVQSNETLPSPAVLQVESRRRGVVVALAAAMTGLIATAGLIGRRPAAASQPIIEEPAIFTAEPAIDGADAPIAEAVVPHFESTSPSVAVVSPAKPPAPKPAAKPVTKKPAGVPKTFDDIQ